MRHAVDGKERNMMTTRGTQTTNSLESDPTTAAVRFASVSHRKRQTSGVPARAKDGPAAETIPRCAIDTGSVRTRFGHTRPGSSSSESENNRIAVVNGGPAYQVREQHGYLSRDAACYDKTNNRCEIGGEERWSGSVHHSELSEVEILHINRLGIQLDDVIIDDDAVTIGDPSFDDASSDLCSWNAQGFSCGAPEPPQSYGNNRRNLYALLAGNSDGFSVNSEFIDSDSRLYENWNAYQESGDSYSRCESVYDIPCSVAFDRGERPFYYSSIKRWMGDLKCEDYGDDDNEAFDPLLQKYPSDLDNVSDITKRYASRDDESGNLKDFDNILRDLGDAIASLETTDEQSNEFSNSLLDIFDELLYTNNFESSQCATSSDDSAVGLNNSSYVLACKLNPRCHVVDLSKAESLGELSILSDEVFLTPDRSMSYSSGMETETPTSSADFQQVEMRRKKKRGNCASWDVNGSTIYFGKGRPVPANRKRNKSLNDGDYAKFIMDFTDYNINRKLDRELDEKLYQEIWECRGDEAPPLPPRGMMLKQYYAELRVQSTLFESISDIPVLIIDHPTPETVRVCSIRKDSETVGNKQDLCKRENGHKYSDVNIENVLNKFLTSSQIKDVCIFENLYDWKRLLKCEDYYDDEEHEWMVVDQELIQEDRSHSQELVIPKIIPRSNNLWTPERLAFKKELQDKLAPVGLSNARSTPKLQIFDDNGGELELRNTIDNNRRKAYAISTITPSLLTKKSSLDRRLLEIDISKVRYSTDVSRKKLLEGGKKGKNWQSNFAVVTDTSIIFWKDKHTYNNYVQALNNPTRSPKLGFVSQHTPELILPLQGLDISLADEGLTSKDRAFRLWASAGQSGSETGVHGVLLRTEHREAAEALLAIMCPGLVSDKALTTSSSTEDFTSAKKSQDSIKRSGSSEHLDREQARFNLLQWFKKRPAKDILINKGIIQGTIFGGSLDAICTSEGSHVPLFVHKCTSRLESGPGFMEADGLYRASANLSMIQRLRIQVDQGNLKAVEEEDDPHVIAGTLKLFFRELKEPLIPFNVFDEFLEASGMPDPKERVERFRELVQSLPPYNKDTLEHVVAHLVCVTRFGDTNRMHVGNLAIVWGPSLMWKPPEDAASGDVPRSPSAVCYDIAVHCFQQNLTIEILITNHDQIFL